MTVVDAHLHLFEAVSPRYPRDVYEPLTPAGRSATAEGFFGFMERAGVDHAVVVGVSHHDEYLRHLRETWPDRFAVVGVIDPEVADQVADLDRRISDTGLQGLRVFTLGEATQPEELEMFRLLEALARRDVKLWFYSSPEQVLVLERVLNRLPELKVVLNHLGFCPDIWDEMQIDEHLRPRFDIEIPPRSLEVVERLASYPSVYVHLSGQYAFSKEPYPHRDLQPVVDAIYGMFGAERMMWASDYPWIAEEPGYPEQLALVDHYLGNLSAAERDAIRGGTALSLFDFG